jgi:hypothetical protein
VSLSATLAAAPEPIFRSIGLSGRGHIVVLLVCAVGAVFLLRLLRRRQLRGKYLLLWILTGTFVLLIATWPGLLDRTARTLQIYNSPNLLFALASAFLLLVCVYFSYELSRLEERTRILAEELAILRAERDAAMPTSGIESGEAPG